MADYRTPLGRARGLGSAKSGVGRFIAERASAAALVPLLLWSVLALRTLGAGDFEGASAWLRSPVNATLTALLGGVGFYHMQLGMRVIIEDYIHRPASKTGLLLLNAFVCGAGGALTIVCILKVALSGGAS
jgi:succinate dehydrogenase / fumarate reductase, membrane anchor subunit